jgi:desulfoferrodoxin-like iron-binding protein
MKKSLFLMALVVFVAGGLMLGLSAAPAAQEAGQAEPYTATSFGPWNAAVAKVHVPEVTLEKMGGALMVTVKVDNHPMDANKPHYIMWIRVEDANGKVLAKHDFKASDPAPTAVFHLNSFPEKLKVLERCNVHGIWMNEVTVKLP